ncbi:NADH dehydrogenase [ubiquinone] 1 alpha subcomplex subunit 11 [Octopus sinensis]|uniref:NADH dehydrogenase [ubiquinone] 1 alpha subcomplex subunit 11 n=1 Tax=Octopus sinensis TaxID=2607531 RepID=A0A6P7TBB9_9MOLL|nr:NADH dehydrogenase [ubiquinone] 1 alpha subcomplex subunit 11 [Octopus sinensis]
MPFESGEDRIVFKRSLAPDLFSTPDGEDILMKSLQSSAFGAYVGVGFGVIDSLRTLTHFTPTNIGMKVVGLSGPLAAIGAAYPAITGIVANIRKKDDPLNHVVGGFVAGSIWGVRYKNPATGWVAAFLFAGFCCINKICHENGVKFYPSSVYNTPSTTLDFDHYRRSFLVTRSPVVGKEDD